MYLLTYLISFFIFPLQIRPVLEKTVGFSQLPDAYAHVEKGKSKGKTVINITDQEWKPQDQIVCAWKYNVGILQNCLFIC